MKLNKIFDEIELESKDFAYDVEMQIGINIPKDYIVFREKYGGITFHSEYGPALILDSIDESCAICGFYKFINYSDLKQIFQIIKSDENGFYKEVNSRKLLRIGNCEGQFEIYIGYGENNYNQIFLYLVEDLEFREYGTLENFINNWIVEYDDKYF
jgi:hypothetical protein